MIKRGEQHKLLAFCVIQQSFLLAAGYGLFLWSGASAGDFVRLGWFDVLLGLALGAGLFAVFWLMLTAFPSLGRRMISEQGRGVFSTEQPYGPGAIMVIATTAGVGEEALFRGGIQTFLAGLMPVSGAIIFSALLFALAHPASWTFMSFIAGVGLTFGLAYHLSGSLLAVMIAHATYDVCGCIWVQRKLSATGHWQPDRLPA